MTFYSHVNIEGSKKKQEVVLEKYAAACRHQFRCFICCWLTRR
ncbi:hypothetical protein CIPAW_01G133900 [Carya illinoinensis]|uniref:Uncharacterized protein n=1 Tax=Carya illinoinensis TaxID=32201 RepID=A0A8T1RMB3_CARIL|nr:hypothetical protein CIPAW_01G133900 [Carya illinoinensis]